MTYDVLTEQARVLRARRLEDANDERLARAIRGRRRRRGFALSVADFLTRPSREPGLRYTPTSSGSSGSC